MKGSAPRPGLPEPLASWVGDTGSPIQPSSPDAGHQLPSPAAALVNHRPPSPDAVQLMARRYQALSCAGAQTP